MSTLDDNNTRNMSTDEVIEETTSTSMSVLKYIAACAFLYSAYVTWNNNAASVVTASSTGRRKLSMLGDAIPTYVEGLMKDLRERQKLFEETPPEEVKYWFEYTGPLQVRVTQGRMLCVQ